MSEAIVSKRHVRMLLVLSLLAIPLARSRAADQPARGAASAAAPSAEVLSDRRVTFRISAPRATSVRFNSADIMNLGQKALMTKADNGVWETTVGPLEPGGYRYDFNVDGVSVVDPRSSSISESNTHVWSLVYVPGSDLMDTKDVPRGAVAEVTYYSKALGRFRRMHVYTPPGYEASQEKYPIFYLLHGASDNDNCWTSVGRAGFILDNLLAAGKVKPMIVAMPAGHTTASTAIAGMGRGAAAGAATQRDEFFEDFVNDVMPYIETHYRVLADRRHRAIAGLSMGGWQTLNVSFAHLDKFAYIGVYSSGILGRGGADTWEQSHLTALDDANLKKGLKLVWFSTGVQDGLMTNTRSTVAMLKKHGFEVEFKESPGAHTWTNWRNYLIEFAPRLFQE